MEDVDSLHRIPTGVEGIDEIARGFPKGGLIVIAGGPGSGKTIFSANFLYTGATIHGDKGVYVSFAENRENFFKHMLQFGWNFEEIEEKKRFKLLDMITVKEEGIETVMDQILDTLYFMDAKRLVIDSYTAMTQAFKEEADSRILLHTILGKISSQLGCTSLLIVETPRGEETL